MLKPAVNSIINVAVPVPIRRTFDFQVPDNQATMIEPGMRVLVPFANRKLIGVICEVKSHSDYPLAKLKQAIEIIDTDSIFSPPLWATIQWLANYYLAPLGEVVDAALPAALRQGKSIQPLSQKTWQLTEHARSADIDELQRAPLQLAIVKRLMAQTQLSATDFKEDSAGWRQAVNSLIKKKWLEQQLREPTLAAHNKHKTTTIKLNTQQQSAITELQALQGFNCALLHGVTGSGKTEVYFAAMRPILDQGKQILLLVPEIGLTPQLVERVSAHFSLPIVSLHSGLNDTERHLAWWHSKTGNARIIIGTRSAVFAPFKKLGMIIVDEEHDGSFKQQDGLRYHARDVAVYRAKQHDIPIILTSATPSLESFANAQAQRYHYLTLTERATAVALPKIHLFDTSKVALNDGLSPMLIEAIKHTLTQKKQVMLFLNRRGFAPVLYCGDCQWTAKCHRCHAHLTIHKHSNRVRCHHCGYEGKAPNKCGECHSDNLVPVGEGTQRVESALEQLFPNATTLRIDRDTTRRKGELESVLEQARNGHADILLGTQLITKGHDFPNVGMVGILNADQGLYSTDFRANEHLFQQILQVAGRAGRRDTVGHVYIQTAFPQHPLFDWVKQHDYNNFANDSLTTRRHALYPPFGYFALLRAESTHQAQSLQFLRQAKTQLPISDGLKVMDAIPAPMEKRAGRFRAQLLIMANKRSLLHAALAQWLQQIEQQKPAPKVRWSLDIDPIDLY